MGKLKVVLSALWYPVAIARYFQHAFMRRSDVDLLLVGPHTGRSIPWAGGMLVDCPFPKPDILLDIGSNSRLMVQSIEQTLNFEPDLWIQIDAAYHLMGKPSRAKHFVIGTDPHCINYDYVRTQADIFFCMQTPYMKEGDVWLPYAYDVKYHAPLTSTFNYDFGIVGADDRQGPLYNPRKDLVEALKGRGYKVLSVFGKAYDDYRLYLSQCRVGLNWSTRLDTTARVFETMGMGIALLTNETPDLAKLGFSRGVHYRGFDNLSEALEQADDLMTNDKWFNLASSGHEAAKEHTWDARVDKVLSYV